jgi:hypothetical protein
MQVMDATMKDPGFGVKPAQNDSPDERARVGRDYLQALMQKYGDPAKAWAAYNAGPGKLDAALAEAEKDAQSGAYRTPGGQPADAWLAKLPKETQAYVAKNMRSCRAAAAKRRGRRSSISSTPRWPNCPQGASPNVVKMTRDQATAQFADHQQVADRAGQQRADRSAALARPEQWQLFRHAAGACATTSTASHPASRTTCSSTPRFSRRARTSHGHDVLTTAWPRTPKRWAP